MFEVNQTAFGRDDEARLVDALRQSTAFIPGLSLVAVHANPIAGGPAAEAIVGHVLFTRIVVEEPGRSHDALALAPLAVVPAHQKRGVGSALVRRGLEEARRLGHTIVIVVGHPEYYPRFGFRPAAVFGIRPPFEVPSEAFMAIELQPGRLVSAQGEVRYPTEFAQF